ncbi:MAG: primosomal protein N' [Ruminococcaceae bacterium]|nr:primosomal protein N' [Oscillospiraceae bacterium]
MPQIAKIAIESATYAIDKPYDYLVPETMELAVGCRVLVPFGRGNRTSEGMVLSLSQQPLPEKQLKAVRENLDPEPMVTEREIRLALWMRQRYFCTFYDAISTILPAGLWYRHKTLWHLEQTPEELSGQEAELCRLLAEGDQEAAQLSEELGEDVQPLLQDMARRGIVSQTIESSRKVGDKMSLLAALAVDGETALAQMEGKQRSAARQYDAVSFLARFGETTLHDLCYYTGITRASVNRLVKQGLLVLRQQEEYRIPQLQKDVKAENITLNEEQQQVFERLLAQSLSGKAGVTLLQGVTGSGKTLVYIRLAQALLEQGKSVMILVPEIALTPQMMARFTAYFGAEVALLHSGLRLTERYDQYKRIRRGEAHIVLGTRSAVFAPLRNLGLIVLDEEQEGSYESGSSPFYHARDIAKYLCLQEGARLLLGSATPTVETAYQARSGIYQLELLRKRYNAHPLPRVLVTDMRQELRAGNTGIISRELYRELAQNLQRGEQSILFLNRRGNSRQLLCPDCGFVPQCPRCSVSLTYHSANGRVMCHYCGYSDRVPQECPECGGLLKQIGIGTQRVEQELQELFPGVQMLRMDADSVGTEHEKLLKKFEKENVPILLGTQMVAKGLDFENVTLVGVLAADLSLYVDHYRAAERTFSLLTQVVGRAGRGDKEGRAVIQTYTPENEVINAAAEQDYDRFYETEIRMRQLRREPPFADQFMITVTGPEEEPVRRACQQLRDGLCAVSGQAPYADMKLEVLGPAPAPVVKLNNRYRYRLTVIGKNERPLRELIEAFMKEFTRRKEHRNMHIFTDCNLMN